MNMRVHNQMETSTVQFMLDIIFCFPTSCFIFTLL